MSTLTPRRLAELRQALDDPALTAVADIHSSVRHAVAAAHELLANQPQAPVGYVVLDNQVGRRWWVPQHHQIYPDLQEAAEMRYALQREASDVGGDITYRVYALTPVNEVTVSEVIK